MPLNGIERGYALCIGVHVRAHTRDIRKRVREKLGRRHKENSFLLVREAFSWQLNFLNVAFLDLGAEVETHEDTPNDLSGDVAVEGHDARQSHKWKKGRGRVKQVAALRVFHPLLSIPTASAITFTCTRAATGTRLVFKYIICIIRTPGTAAEPESVPMCGMRTRVATTHK